MTAPPKPALRFLWHPGTRECFCGYGLALRPAHLVGLVMIDRPEPADPTWLAAIQRTFGDYQITAMTHSGERGLVCQMRIVADSTRYLRVFASPRTQAIRDALLPLLDHLPRVTLALSWHPESKRWVSQIVEDTVPRFSLGRVVATPGALRALEQAEQSPQEFLDRHVHGDWGEVPEADQQENEFSIHQGFRILSPTPRVPAREFGYSPKPTAATPHCCYPTNTNVLPADGGLCFHRLLLLFLTEDLRRRCIGPSWFVTD